MEADLLQVLELLAVSPAVSVALVVQVARASGSQQALVVALGAGASVRLTQIRSSSECLLLPCC